MLTGCYKKTNKNFQKGIVKIKKKINKIKNKDWLPQVTPQNKNV